MKNDICVRDVMRQNVTFVDGRVDVMEAMRIMKRVGATSLIVEKRHPHDEYGMVLFSDIAKEVVAKDRAPDRVNVKATRGEGMGFVGRVEGAAALAIATIELPGVAA